MADVTLRATETRYIRFPVTAAADPLTDDIEAAFVAAADEPSGGDWQDAEWEPGQTWAAGSAVWARILVGPNGGVELDPGSYMLRARITDDPEILEPDIGSIRIRAAAALNAADLLAIRQEIGTGAPPTDGDLDDLWTDLASVPAVALAILRPRRADALAAAGQGGFTLSGVLGTTAPTATAIALMDAQIARLEAQLAAETGVLDTAGFAASSVIAGRTDRPR